MNILPLVCTLLLLMSLGVYSFLKQGKTTVIESGVHSSFMEVDREARNKLVSRAYHNAHKASSENKSEGRKENSPFVSHRFGPRIAEGAKFNLAPLLTSAQTPPLLYETAARLLRILYGKELFSSYPRLEMPEYKMLDEMIEMGRKKKEVESLSDLFPENSMYKEIFYSMLKGMHEYDLPSQKGYPPLEHFFVLDLKSKQIAIHFNLAAKPLLEALFPPPAVEAILKEEFQKWQKDGKKHTLRKRELLTLLEQHPPAALNFSSIETFTDFQKKQLHYSTIEVQDKKTGISVNKRI